MTELFIGAFVVLFGTLLLILRRLVKEIEERRAAEIKTHQQQRALDNVQKRKDIERDAATDDVTDRLRDKWSRD